MTSLAIPEDWGRGRGGRGRGESHDKHKNNDQKIEMITLDFLPVVGRQTVHHEPPEFEARPKVKIILDHAGHATFHWLRYEMFGREEDHNAYMGQASLMNEEEAAREEEISNSPEILELIRQEIRKRGKPEKNGNNFRRRGR